MKNHHRECERNCNLVNYIPLLWWKTKAKLRIPWMDFPLLLIVFQYMMIWGMNYFRDFLAMFYSEYSFVASLWPLCHTKWFQIRYLTFQVSYPTGWEVLYTFLNGLSRLIRIYNMLWGIRFLTMYLIIDIIKWNKSLDNVH